MPLMPRMPFNHSSSSKLWRLEKFQTGSNSNSQKIRINRLSRFLNRLEVEPSRTSMKKDVGRLETLNAGVIVVKIWSVVAIVTRNSSAAFLDWIFTNSMPTTNARIWMIELNPKFKNVCFKKIWQRRRVKRERERERGHICEKGQNRYFWGFLKLLLWDFQKHDLAQKVGCTSV